MDMHSSEGQRVMRAGILTGINTGCGQEFQEHQHGMQTRIPTSVKGESQRQFKWARTAMGTNWVSRRELQRV